MQLRRIWRAKQKMGGIHDNTDNLRPNQYPLGAHGEYSSPRQEVDCRGTLSKLSSRHIPVGCRSAADVEQELTSLILKAQQEHEEIILEVTDFTPGTQYGYDHPCEPELQQYEIDARRAEQRYYKLHPEECKG